MMSKRQMNAGECAASDAGGVPEVKIKLEICQV